MFEQIAQNPFNPEEPSKVQFLSFPYGLNTTLRPSLLNRQELAAAKNVMYRALGKLTSRPPIEKVTDTAIGTPCNRCTVSLPSGQYIFSADTDGNIYYDVGSTPTLIGTVGSSPFLLAYKGAVMIMDKGLLKYCDTVSEIKLAYDAGQDGTQYSMLDTESIDITDDGNVTGASIGVRVTTENWEAGYTIPPTEMQFKVQATAAGATLTAKVKKTDGTTIASKVVAQSISQTQPEYIQVVFTSDDITEELQPNTAYDFMLEGTNFQLHYHAVSSGGHYYNGTSVDTTKDPIMKIHPGIPPKASFGGITGKATGSRLFILNPDEPGRLYFGDKGFKDWSTDNGGGWVGVIDDNQNSFPVGSFEILYGTLYVYGTEANPYICSLTGTEPNNYSIDPVFSHGVGDARTLINVNNDLLDVSKSGVGSLRGVQESGDVRTQVLSKRINNEIQENWGNNTFAGFDPQTGHFLLKLENDDSIYIGATRYKFQEGEEGMGIGEAALPWTTFEFPVTPTWFSSKENTFVFGAVDGFFYKFADSGTKDLNTDYPEILIESPITTLPGDDFDLELFQIYAASITGAQFDFTIRIDGSLTPSYEKTISLIMNDFITVDELGAITVDEWVALVDPIGSYLFFPININCTAFQWVIDNVKLVSNTLDFDGVVLDVMELI